MDDKYLITYDAVTVIAVVPAPTTGAIVSGTSFLIDTLENARGMLMAIGVDISIITSETG